MFSMLKSLFRFSAIFLSITIITVALTSCITSKSNLFELTNNQSGQISSQRQLYVIDDQIYYQTDKGFYQNNSQGKNIKIHDLNLTSCYKRDNWIYAMTDIINSAGYTGNYLYDFILRFTTSGEIETVVDQAVFNVFYTEQKMFFHPLKVKLKNTLYILVTIQGKTSLNYIKARSVVGL